MKRSLFVLIAAVTLGACATTPVSVQPVQAPHAVTSNAHEAIGLFDPFSAHFRNERTYRLSNGQYAQCGEVNAKNRFGAYVGWKPFYVRLTVNGNQPAVIHRAISDETARIGCQKAAAGEISIAS